MALAFLGLKKLKPKPPHKPHVAKDTASSNTIFAGLYGLAEGEIAGLVDGGKSILLDDTPLINANGTPNFKNISWDFRVGTNDQSHIAGFPAVENEQSVGVELRHDKAWTKYINNTQLSAIRLRLNWNALRVQHENGDITGHKIEYAVDIQTDGGRFDEVLKTQIHDKTSQGYKRSHRIELPKANKGWTIRVRRLTANRDNEMVADTMTVDAITEIIDAKLRYPNTALLGLRYDAKIFSNIANIAVHLKGKIIAVPSNYNAQTRDYVGLWDGTFQQAYSDNPAWIFYDICTNKRYGLGERLTGMIDKWSLYRIAQYCDEMVDDGKGGQEPRFTCNVYLQKQEDAYTVLKNLASIFRAMMYYDGEQIVLDIDGPKDPVYTFSATNVIDGIFNYSGTRARDRHNIAQVAWDNPDNNYKTEYAFIRDEQAISRLGVRVLNINAFGCTSQGQAQRAGLWALKSEQLETRTVSFSTGLEGFVPQVGQVINIADNVFAGRAISGRIISISEDKRTLTLDREIVANAGDTLVINGSNGNEKQVIQSISGVNITVHTAFSDIAVDNIWAINSDDLRMMQFRILAISQNEATFDITALQYERQKYTAIDDGVISNISPISVLNPDPIASPNHVTITSHNRVVQTQTVTTLSISWEQVKGATAYIVEWRKDDGVWQSQTVSGQLLDVEGVYAGRYLARVRAVDAFGNESLATLSQLTAISGKHGRPPRPARLTVLGILFGMKLSWVFARGSDDTSFTQIQVSPDGRANIATLGTFAYPTNKHEITGLQGNLTQYYRARIVDKLGNTSDWTAWVSGTTDAQADKVLDLLQGQISQSHLDQSLRTPIAKIGGIETGLNGIKNQMPTLQSAISAINGQLPTLNNKIAAAERNLQTAQNTLNMAVANITTERNRITSAIRDITALQSANNAKTQEIANLTQTVNGHTSSIRELGVTTGDLSQKYSQLKTVADKATSDITQIKQTQAGQVINIERLGAKFDNLAVGGRNLIPNTQKHGNANNGIFDGFNVIKLIKPTERYIDYQYRLTRAMHESNCVFSFWAKADVDNVIVTAHLYSPNTITKAETSQGGIFKRADGMANIALSTEWRHYYVVYTQTPSDTPKAIVLRYQSSRLGSEIFIAKPKLEIGTIATDWTPAPEDVQSDIDTAKTQAEANINTVRETLTNADIALGRRIDDVSAEFKQADNTIKASVQEEITARTNADNALTQRIDSLQTDYNGNKASVANQLKTLSDKDTATAQKLTQFESNLGQKANATALNDLSTRVTQVDGKITAEVQKISTLQTTIGRHTASIEQHTKSLHGLSAQWTLKVQSGNIVSGIGLASSNGVSDFAVRANKFYIAPPTGTTKTPLFSVVTTPTTLNGVTVPVGNYLSNAFIQNGSITNAKIANAAITSAKIGAAQIGTAHIANGAIDAAKIKDATITNAKIGHAQVDTLQIKDGAIIVPRMQYNAGFRTFYESNEIEIGRITIDAKGGNVMINFGFQRLFSVPNGAYTWGVFVPAIDETDFHNFVHAHVYDNTYNRVGNVSFHIRRNGSDIHNVFFRPNYAKNDSTALSWLNINRETPILLYDQYSSPAIVDNPPSGNTTYTLLMVVFSSSSHFNNDRNISRRTILKGLSFGVMGVKR